MSTEGHNKSYRTDDVLTNIPIFCLIFNEIIFFLSFIALIITSAKITNNTDYIRFKLEPDPGFQGFAVMS